MIKVRAKPKHSIGTREDETIGDGVSIVFLNGEVNEESGRGIQDVSKARAQPQVRIPFNSVRIQWHLPKPESQTVGSRSILFVQ